MSGSRLKKLWNGLAVALLIVADLSISYPLFANQENTVSLRVQNAPLHSVFTEIRKQTGLIVFYNNQVLNDKDRVSVNVVNERIEKVMHQLLRGKSVSFRIDNEYIIISRQEAEKPAEKTLVADTIPGRTVVGKVVSKEDGSPLLNVTVMIPSSGRGTATDAKGQFRLVAEPGDSIRFSYVGRSPVTVLYSGQPMMSILMESGSENMLNDVVVTGFQNIDKKKFSGAATRIKADDAKLNGVVDVSRMLEGRAAGVSVQNVSGTFGTAPKVRVRGATSINGDNKPLWVVDGVVLEDIVNISNDQLTSGDPTTLLGSAVAGLNANDIESFEILKDAAATALYGARAMNGVVVITTKRGKAGKPVITYTGNFSTYLKPQYADYNIMNSGKQMSVLAELERKGLLTSDILSRGDVGVYGKYFDLLNDYSESGFPVENTPEAKQEFLLRYAKANTNWYDLLFQNNFMQEHSVSVSTGTDKSQSYFSTSYYGDNGWTIADKVSRYTLNFRNNYKFSDKVSTGFSTLASMRRQKAPGSLSRNSNPVEGQYDREFDINPFSYALNTSRTLTAYDEHGNLEYFRRNFAPFNIINELENNYIDLNILDARLQGDLSWKINRNLRYEFVGALRFVKSSREHQITEKSNMANAYRANENATIAQNNKFLYRDPENPNAEPQVVLPYGGFYNRTEDQMFNYDIRNNLNFNKTFNEVHNINVLVGHQVKYTDRQNASNTGYGYQYGNGGNPFIDYRILKQTIESNFPYYSMMKDYDRFGAFYADAHYTFNNKYNIGGTVRYEGSNKLGESESARWLPTWSVSGSWNVDQEKFMRNADWLDYLTVRGSYGLTASMGPATNSGVVLQNANTNRTHLNERESVIKLMNLQNDDLTWEKLYAGNIGFDAGFLKRRLTLTLDLYDRKSFDLISIIKTSGIGGEMYKAANYADMSSKGLEVMIGGEIIRKKDWGWRANFTMGYNTNKITTAKNIPTIFDLVGAEGGNKEGYPVRSLFSIQYKGLDPNSGYPLFLNEKGEISPSVYLQDDSTQFLKYEGPVDPPYTGGLNNTFRYKNLSLNIFLTYQFGNRIRLYPAFRTAYTDFDAMPNEFFDRWVQKGEEAQTSVPSIVDAFEQLLISGAYPYNNYNYSDARTASGAFVRLKSVSLSYLLPNRLMGRTGINNVSFALSANNLWLIYADKKLNGQDPEFFNTGGVAQPIQRQITFSVKMAL
ncbi:SusC/RagA family TonB-linked outer membrane protein [Flavihumibacter petaseus]|uniref:Putative TonB-dependent receptor n=1 Tax=Flavihumibacter petaseus NBRC 106054 TaxID=1220578 RepID=A0A0E9MZN6_9BACT|nr:SusC/RagA family TonB-linked outer membrane protein [Flavihumibacter petaseus]GAO42585.1 putative TonB-dependent receptor [Flavihumibacter petaseus NBRC 106054]